MKAAVLEPVADLIPLQDVAIRPRKVALVGQPNVGKSLVFSQLTSHYVTISNFPGTTVEVFRGLTQIEGQEVEVLDTPGINGISASSEDEKVTLEVLENESPDVIVQIADAKNLRRALLLTEQLSHFDIPLLLVLNMMDECHERGISIDTRSLETRLGIPVLETVATNGQGVEELENSIPTARHCRLRIANPLEWAERLAYDVQISSQHAKRSSSLRTRVFTLASAAGAFLHLENYLGPLLGLPTLAGLVEAATTRLALHEALSTSMSVTLAYLIPVLLPVLWAIRVDTGFNERFGVWARNFLSGAVILAVTLSLTYQLVGNLGAQVFVGLLEESLFATYITPFLRESIPSGFFFDLLVGDYGIISMGLAYGIAIVLPVVSTFFVAFSFLEDSGYLPRLSILSDRLLRAMGLHGKAFLPMVLGLGCVTMATMTTRILSSKKERFVATLLLALGVPCSAQLGVVLGITSSVSFKALLIVFGTVAFQLFLVGFILSRLYPGTRSSFILELPPIRCPVWKNIVRKTYWRVRWFLREALPLFALGAFVLFILDKLGLLKKIISFSEPLVVNLLGLPSQTASIFLMGFLRRDYGAAGLFDLSKQGLLDTGQIVVGLVVLTLFVPCIANTFVMIKEQGFRNALLMVAFIFTYALAVGTILNWLLRSSQVFI